MTDERLTITQRTGGNRVTLSRSESLDEDTASELIRAGACRGGVADPKLIRLAGDVLAAEARRLKFAHPEHTLRDCLFRAIEALPSAAHIWSRGRQDNANLAAFEIID